MGGIARKCSCFLEFVQTKPSCSDSHDIAFRLVETQGLRDGHGSLALSEGCFKDPR